MRDVTPHLLAYREAFLDAWNAQVTPSTNWQSPEFREAFDTIERGLFTQIVLAPLNPGARAEDVGAGSLAWLWVVPPAGSALWPLSFGEEQDWGVRWSTPGAQDIAAIPHFAFTDFFQWDWNAPVELTHVRGRLPDGRSVMAEIGDCRFMLRL